MTEFNPQPDLKKHELTLRHIREMGAKYADFLIENAGTIDPIFADELTDEQEAVWQKHSHDLRVTQEIEKFELS